MAKITKISAREIFDSRGNPTIETDLWLDDGSFGRAAVPSGASTGKYEAVELRDGDKMRLEGKGVKNAVWNVNGEIFSALAGIEASQSPIDQKMRDLDGTENKSRLGANAILSVSLAAAKAIAVSEKTELWNYFRKLSTTVPQQYLMPVPMLNVLNGGRHASNASDFQEYMIVPTGAENFSRAMEMAAQVFMSLKKVLAGMGFVTTVGDEGGFAPALASNEKPIQIIKQAVEESGLRFGEDISVAMDVAASEFYHDGGYELKSENKRLSSAEMIQMLKEWKEKYPIVSIEDGLDQDDWDGHTNLTQILGDSTQLVGDDLFVTNIKRLQTGIERKAANAILIKLNQIGTLTETIEAVDLARKNGFNAIISHRSGETEDTTIADLVVGLSTGQIKTGSMSRSERVAKYNQLLRIEEQLNGQAVYPGKKVFSRE
jgi:enolase